MDFLKKGASVFFFPEGTRSKDGKLGAFKVRSMFRFSSKNAYVCFLSIVLESNPMATKQKPLSLHNLTINIHPSNCYSVAGKHGRKQNSSFYYPSSQQHNAVGVNCLKVKTVVCT